jgi:two-component system CheB/CheR fusion protein
MKKKTDQLGSQKGAERSQSAPAKIVSVVSIGASAGGLEAFSELLKNLPIQTGMAFVFVQHLDPRHSSQLVQILTRDTTLPIKEATDGELLRPDQIHIMPPNHEMTLEKGALRLWARSEIRGRHMAIDRFFASVAEEQGSGAIGSSYPVPLQTERGV